MASAVAKRARHDVADYTRRPWWARVIPPPTLMRIHASIEISLKLPVCPPDDEVDWLDHCRAIVRRVSDGTFYIGIANDPPKRFQQHACNGFDRMTVLAAVESSSVSGRLERGLLSEYLGKNTCMNTGAGGESASPGSPHFVYVVWREDGMMRRAHGGSSKWSADSADVQAFIRQMNGGRP